MSNEPADFRVTDGGAFVPTPFAQSRWGDDHLNGPAVVGLAARALENHCGSDDFMPARFTADLFRAARNVPTTLDVRVVRDGRRVRNAEYEIEPTAGHVSAPTSTTPPAAVTWRSRVVVRWLPRRWCHTDRRSCRGCTCHPDVRFLRWWRRCIACPWVGLADRRCGVGVLGRRWRRWRQRWGSVGRSGVSTAGRRLGSR
jgi:hypothetical protein